MEYPELAARTRSFTAGAPRAVTVGADGQRVAFLRSLGPDDPVDRLWVFDVASRTERLAGDPSAITDAGLPDAERALRERLRLTAEGIGSFATDADARVAAFAVGGKLVVADLVTATATARKAAGAGR